jgi:hypothetical protein
MNRRKRNSLSGIVRKEESLYFDLTIFDFRDILVNELEGLRRQSRETFSEK